MVKIRRGGGWLLVLLAAGALSALPGCREEEHDRSLLHEPGGYQGREDRPLTPEQVDELRDRAHRQRF